MKKTEKCITEKLGLDITLRHLPQNPPTCCHILKTPSLIQREQRHEGPLMMVVLK